MGMCTSHPPLMHAPKINVSMALAEWYVSNRRAKCMCQTADHAITSDNTLRRNMPPGSLQQRTVVPSRCYRVVASAWSSSRIQRIFALVSVHQNGENNASVAKLSSWLHHLKTRDVNHLPVKVYAAQALFFRLVLYLEINLGHLMI